MLVAKDLTVRLSSLSAVQGVSLEVHRGEIVGLLGPSGAGKTAVFRMLTGVLNPDDGSVYMDDADITWMAMFERARRGLTYLSQEPSVIKGLTVEQNLMLVLEARETSAHRLRMRIERSLADFRLVSLRDKLAGSLSGGERRRCEIARAVVVSPRYLLLDEPFAGVDPIAIGEIRKLVVQISRAGIGVLITDHNVREMLRMVDRAYIIDAGAILALGTPEELIRSSLVQDAYLGNNFRL
jgi:lipopolysaccharide export system ATP-binding protein